MKSCFQRNELIKLEKTEDLMHIAAQIHGHYCPGLAKGVMAAVYAVNKLSVESDGMEDLLAIVETNNCFSDGVQFTTGCTFGNNSLVFKDFGKTAFTLACRNGKGLRLCSSAKSRQIARDAFPEYQKLFQKVVVEQNRDEALLAEYKIAAYNRSVGILKLDVNDLFDIKPVHIQIPDYARIVESFDCELCKENTMTNRTFKNNAQQIACFDCGKSEYFMLDGNGIKKMNN